MLCSALIIGNRALLVVFRLMVVFLGFAGNVFAQGNKFVVQNVSGISRKAEPMVISRENLAGIIRIPDKQLPQLYYDETDKLIPTQVDDLSGDGKWDELAFQIDLERSSEVIVRVKWFDADEYKPATFGVHAGLYGGGTNGNWKLLESEYKVESTSAGSPNYYLEGPVWESEKVAFRHCFDGRLCTLPIGKKQTGLLRETFQLGKKKDDWAKEILHFDTSIGICGFAINDGSGYKLPAGAGACSYRLIARGPVRAIFDLIYEDWQLGDAMVNVRQRNQIWSGQNGYKTEIFFGGFEGERDVILAMPLSASLQKAENASLNRSYTSLTWHGAVGDDHEMAGMALIASATQVKGVVQPDEAHWPEGIKRKSVALKFRVASGQSIPCQLFFGWEKANDYYGNAVQFKNELQLMGDMLDKPLKIADVK